MILSFSGIDVLRILFGRLKIRSASGRRRPRRLLTRGPPWGLARLRRPLQGDGGLSILAAKRKQLAKLPAGRRARHGLREQTSQSLGVSQINGNCPRLLLVTPVTL